MADTGVIEAANGLFVVEDTIKLQGGKIGHVGTMKKGSIGIADKVTLTVVEQKIFNCKKSQCNASSAEGFENRSWNHVEQPVLW